MSVKQPDDQMHDRHSTGAKTEIIVALKSPGFRKDGFSFIAPKCFSVQKVLHVNIVLLLFLS